MLKALGWVIVGSDSAKNHMKDPTKTHHQSASSSLLQELLADPSLAHEELFRRLLQAGLQDLIDAEATTKIGAGPYERTEHRVTGRNGTRPKPSRPRQDNSTSRSPNSVRDRSSRPCSTPAAASTRPSTQ